MPSLRLGKTAYKAFDGNTYEESISIERETPKALMIRIIKRGKERDIWIPRSVCAIRVRPLIRIKGGKPVTSEDVTEIHIKEWWWNKEIEGEQC